MSRALKTLEGHVNSVVKPEVNKAYEQYIPGFKAENLGIKIADKEDCLFCNILSFINPFPIAADAFVMHHTPGIIYVDVERAEKHTGKFKGLMVHEYIHCINQQVSEEYNKPSEGILFLDEGIATFLSKTEFSHLVGRTLLDNLRWQKARAENRILTSQLSRLLDRYVFNARELEDCWQLIRTRNEPYIVGHDFFKKISKEHGMEEVFKVVANPEFVDMETIRNPGRYSPGALDSPIAGKDGN